MNDPTPSRADVRAGRHAARAQRFAAEAAAETTSVTPAERRTRTRRSVLTGGAAVAAGALGWRWVQRQPEDGGIPGVLRDTFQLNEQVWSTLHDPGQLAPEFPESAIEEIRVNGLIGLRQPMDVATWLLRVEDGGGRQVDELTVEEVTALPRTDMVIEHKCIEGWSAITSWTGTRFSELALRYGSLAADAPYVALETPDREYYVGLDADTVMHPQTLLAWGWNGFHLTPERGAPLRLETPLHYGIKSLKRIGTIRFTDERPADYWAERGYDWDSSH